jgi:hypothetical protein
MNKFPIAIALIFSVGIYSCRPARKIQTTAVPTDTAKAAPVVVNNSKADSIALVTNVYEQVKKRRIDFKTFSAKIKVEYTDKNGKGPDLTVFARVQKDSAIWLSINATVFSYEAFRVLITKDSVIVLNKKDKEAQLRSLSYLQKLTQLPFDFATMQDLIIGNPVYLGSEVISFKQDGALIMMLLTGGQFKNSLTVSGNEYLVQSSRLEDLTPLVKRTCDLTYSDYENKNGMQFPIKRKIVVAEKSKLEIDMEFKQYGFNENLSYPITIPKNYKRN